MTKCYDRIKKAKILIKSSFPRAGRKVQGRRIFAFWLSRYFQLVLFQLRISSLRAVG